MRVFLAAQFASQTAIKMIQDHCNSNFTNNLEDFAPMMTFLDKLDRLIGIMPGCGFSKGKDQDVEPIDEPKHCLICELFDILCLFVQWKR